MIASGLAFSRPPPHIAATETRGETGAAGTETTPTMRIS